MSKFKTGDAASVATPEYDGFHHRNVVLLSEVEEDRGNWICWTEGEEFQVAHESQLTLAPDRTNVFKRSAPY